MRADVYVGEYVTARWKQPLFRNPPKARVNLTRNRGPHTTTVSTVGRRASRVPCDARGRPSTRPRRTTHTFSCTQKGSLGSPTALRHSSLHTMQSLSHSVSTVAPSARASAASRRGSVRAAAPAPRASRAAQDLSFKQSSFVAAGVPVSRSQVGVMIGEKQFPHAHPQFHQVTEIRTERSVPDIAVGDSVAERPRFALPSRRTGPKHVLLLLWSRRT